MPGARRIDGVFAWAEREPFGVAVGEFLRQMHLAGTGTRRPRRRSDASPSSASLSVKRNTARPVAPSEPSACVAAAVVHVPVHRPLRRAGTPAAARRSAPWPRWIGNFSSERAVILIPPIRVQVELQRSAGVLQPSQVLAIELRGEHFEHARVVGVAPVDSRPRSAGRGRPASCRSAPASASRTRAIRRRRPGSRASFTARGSRCGCRNRRSCSSRARC